MENLTKSEEVTVESLDIKLKALNKVINTLVMSLSDVTQKNAEIGMHLAALLKTIEDGRPLDAANLAESSIKNMVDKLDAYVKLALDRGFLRAAPVVAGNSVVAVQHLDEKGNEVTRKMLLNLNEQTDDVKQAFSGSKISQVVTAPVDTGEMHKFVVLEVYEPTEGLTEELK